MKLSDELKTAVRELLAQSGFYGAYAPSFIKTLESIPNAHIVTVKDVYGTDEPDIPNGFEQVEFRCVKADDEYLTVYQDRASGNDDAVKVIGPRIILRRRKVTRKQWVFTETGEHRHAERGEWFGDLNDHFLAKARTFLKYNILRCEEHEIEVDA